MGLMWCIQQKRNRRNFQGLEQTVLKLKNQLLTSFQGKLFAMATLFLDSALEFHGFLWSGEVFWIG